MQSLPKYSAERARLQAHLETQRQLIHGDVDEIKTSLKPLAIAKQVVSEAANSFRDNSFATQATRLALTVLPRGIRHPLVGIAAQIVVPMLVRQVPALLQIVKNKREQGNSGGLAHTKVEVISGLRRAVSSLRDRIR